MTRAGMPTATASLGTSFSTTALAPITTLSPMVTGPMIFAPTPISTSLPIIGAVCVAGSAIPCARSVLL